MFIKLHGSLVYKMNLFRKLGLQRFGPEFYDLNHGYGAPLPVKGRQGIEPTFWEFISAVLNVIIKIIEK